MPWSKGNDRQQEPEQLLGPRLPFTGVLALAKKAPAPAIFEQFNFFRCRFFVKSRQVRKNLPGLFYLFIRPAELDVQPPGFPSD